MHGGMQRTLLRPKAEAGVQARHTGEGGGRRGSVDTAGPGTQPEPGPLCLVELTQDDGGEEVSLGSGAVWILLWTGQSAARQEREKQGP